MNKGKAVYWASTGALSVMMSVAAIMYFTNYDHVSTEFAALGYPVYLVYPLACLKLCGVVALLSGFSRVLTEWAYAGFFYDFCLALSAHYMAGDGEYAAPVAALMLVLTSRCFACCRNSI